MSFPKLRDYLLKMDNLVALQRDQTCVICKRKYDFFKFENLVYSFKEDSLFCNNCYYEYLEKLVNFGLELGPKPYFTVAWDSGLFNMQAELKKYAEVRKYRQYAQHTIFPNLVEWCERMEKLSQSD